MKYCILFLFGVISSYSVCGQPGICNPPPAMTSFCNQACIICDINGFLGRNNSNITGQAPPGFCTSVVHHMQWIGFIAGSQDLSIEVHVTNCNLNNGLEIGLYESFNCQNFRRVSECDTDVRPNQRRIFNNTVPLTIGQYYYLVMDGSANDVCNYSVRVLSGSTQVALLNVMPDIDMPLSTCVEDWVEFRTTGLTGATFYDWFINGVFIENNREIRHQFTEPGSYEICLNAYNVCSRAPVNCQRIVVLDLPIKVTEADLCFGQCYSFYGENYCSSGTYVHRIKNSEDCDSVIVLALNIADRVTTTANLHICEGDTLRLGNDIFTKEGNHQTIITTNEGCQILLIFNLKLIQCNIISFSEVQAPQCSYTDNGIITLSIEQGTPPLRYSGFKTENPSLFFRGEVTFPGEEIKLTGIGGGNYHFRIEDNYGNESYIHVYVPQPAPIITGSEISKYNGFSVSCHDGNDGWIKIQPKGGSPPYNILYSIPNTSGEILSGISSGSYFCKITDTNNCLLDTVIWLNSPDPVSINYNAVAPDCSSKNSGQISLQTVNGGVPPYRTEMNQIPIDALTTVLNLSNGSYILSATDLNNCVKIEEIKLEGSEIPVFNINPAQADIDLGEGIALNIQSLSGVENINWSPPDGLDCADCISTNASPVQSTIYNATVTSKDGCSRSQNVEIRVRKTRSFVISNISTPDGNTVNDRLVYFAGKDVASIPELHIFDRWGNKIFTDSILDKGLNEVKWDCSFNGQKVSTGMYPYWVKVIYLDGEEVLYKGSIVIL